MSETEETKEAQVEKTRKSRAAGFGMAIVYLSLLLCYLWCAPAVYFLDWPWEWARLIAAGFYTIGAPAVLILFRGDRRALWGVVGVTLFFCVCFSLRSPSNDRNWTPDVAKMPEITFLKNDKVRIRNIRDFIYESQTEFKPRYYDATYDLNDLTGADYILSYWNGDKAVAHSMFSFAFKDGRHLCVSVEMRREKGEPQTGLRGLYNQYELIYIPADERDILLLRTNHRHEEVYVYPLSPKKPENVRKVLVEILRRAQSLRKHPRFYNTIRDNCFTTLFKDVKRVTGNPSYFDYRVILNGFSDELGYERGWFKTDGLPFDEFKRRHHINPRVEDDPDARTGYSRKIRSGNEQ